jgi:peptidase S24-like protein
MVTSNNTMLNLRIWLEEALSWLHADGLQDVLQKPHGQLLEIMSAARDENRSNQVWEMIDEMERLALQMTDTREQGEVFIRCATMAADLENLKDALRLFQAAESKYKSYPHQDAVVLWMIGCIHWMARQKVEGISRWQAAISLFSSRQLNVQVDAARAQWYVDKLPELEGYLAQAITTGVLPIYGSNPSSSIPAPTEPETAPASFFEFDSLRWVSCQISESIPAGGFGPVGFDPNPVGFLEISEVLIEDEPYQVHSVRRQSARRSTVNFSSQAQYRTVHITGTSMNDARPVPIDDGDYVLIQCQIEPEDNDIVIAGIIGHDDRATVKRLRRSNGKIRLIPESTDTIHYELDLDKEFNEFDEDFQIIGVVEAVFKKKPS